MIVSSLCNTKSCNDNRSFFPTNALFFFPINTFFSFYFDLIVEPIIICNSIDFRASSLYRVILLPYNFVLFLYKIIKLLNPHTILRSNSG